MHENIYRTIWSIGPKNIWEIGVAQPDLCRSSPFIKTGIPVKMVEPFDSNYRKLVQSYGKFQNVDILNIALFDRNGEIELNQQGECSYVEGVVSPTVFAGGKADSKILVPCCKISHFDHGQIDVALLDVEGSEWKIISQMVSRPRIISLEMSMRIGNTDKVYNTPDSDKILSWLSDNKYTELPFNDVDRWFQRSI